MGGTEPWRPRAWAGCRHSLAPGQASMEGAGLILGRREAGKGVLGGGGRAAAAWRPEAGLVTGWRGSVTRDRHPPESWSLLPGVPGTEHI